ncbi:DNA-binding MurR/RpiR family transcriptional regulator [Microbacterium sp. W4I4]|uniref:MurR/RpiR family transcriptional regulator n=1 Tax=Microbacterium sp. W4I4 TaxID=3042295 RepID=UPI0027860BC5|nr:MurR/RpiR family transcriptional regulator [Microbacterium sp. W4I4]MDQ0615260.1 DNA-binding MurR/RpiR family transcriptional regulator [Microbacterium sp. W4I4]
MDEGVPAMTQAGSASELPLDALVRGSLDSLSSGERKVGRALLANYPIAGLGTVAELAQRASVSPPTVVRFANRLGFSGYPEFQKRLVREVQERLGSPLEQYGRADLHSGDDGLPRASQMFAASIAATIDDLPQSEFDRAVALLSDPHRRVRLIGGRFSRLLAEYLGAHLILLRPDVQVIEADEFSRIAAVSDTRRGDLLVVFDYRRYDPQIVRFSRRVAERGGELVLFTDRWLSPAAEVAGTVLPANVEAPSPFDSLVPAMAIVETVIAGITEVLGEIGRQRLEGIEALRAAPPAPAG